MKDDSALAARRPWDPRAEPLLAMAERATEALVHVDSRRLRAKAAVPNVEQTGDLMVLHWDIAFREWGGEMILRDTARVSSYALLLRGPISTEQMEELLPALVGRNLSKKLAASGTVFFTPSERRQFDVTDSIQAAMNPNGDWMVAVHRDKGFLRGFYFGDTGLQRFPTLAERIRSASLSELTASLKREAPMSLDPANDIVLAEIASRKPPFAVWENIFLQEVQTWTNRKYAEGVYQRLSKVLDALQRHDPSNESAAAFRKSIRKTIESLGEGTDRLQSILAIRIFCTQTEEQAALAQLNQQTELEAAFNYLGRCATSPEIFAKIQALPPFQSNTQENARQRALMDIRGRQPQRLR
jgi:hypothetical protein